MFLCRLNINLIFYRGKIKKILLFYPSTASTLITARCSQITAHKSQFAPKKMYFCDFKKLTIDDRAT